MKLSFRNIITITRIEFAKKKSSFHPLALLSLGVVIFIFIIGWWLLFSYAKPLTHSYYEVDYNENALDPYFEGTSFTYVPDSDIKIRKGDMKLVYFDKGGIFGLSARSALSELLISTNKKALLYYNVSPLFLLYLNLTYVEQNISVIEDKISSYEHIFGEEDKTPSILDEPNSIEQDFLNAGEKSQNNTDTSFQKESSSSENDGGPSSDTTQKNIVENDDSNANTLNDNIISEEDTFKIEDDSLDAETDMDVFFQDQDSLVFNETLDVDDLHNTDDIDTFSFAKNLLLLIQIIFVLNIASGLFGTSIYEEKINQRSSLLFSAAVSSFEFIIGKALPYFIFSFIASIAFLFFYDPSFLTHLPVFLILIELIALYLSITCLNGFLARSTKEFSFLNLFSVSVLSLYLLIPGFLANISELSYASLLTPLLHYSNGTPVSYNLLFFVMPAYALVAVLIFFIASKAWDYESLYGFFTPGEHLTRLLSIFLTSYPLFFLYGMFVVAFGWVIQLGLIVVVLSINFLGKYFLFFIIAAFFEEYLRNYGVRAVLKNKSFDLRGFKKSFLASFLIGLGFLFSEKIFLLLSIAPFIDGFRLLVAAGLIVPLMIHFGFTFMYLSLAKRYAFFINHYFLSMVLFGCVHGIFNFLTISLVGGLV